jgi:phosphoglycolate phosphatase
VKKELIIFDMDGTLIDSGNVITNTVNFVRTQLGLEPIEKHIMLDKLNDPTINSAKYFYGTKEFTEEQTKLFHEYYDTHCITDIILYDGIEEILKSLKPNCLLTIATNASTDFAVKMIQHLGVDNYFDMVIGATCVQKPKPHPDMLLKTLENFKKNNHQAILIGDSHKDRLAAKAANMDSILVNWGFTTHDKDTAFDCTYKLHSHLQTLTK